MRRLIKKMEIHYKKTFVALCDGGYSLFSVVQELQSNGVRFFSTVGEHEGNTNNNGTFEFLENEDGETQTVSRIVKRNGQNFWGQHVRIIGRVCTLEVSSFDSHEDLVELARQNDGQVSTGIMFM